MNSSNFSVMNLFFERVYCILPKIIKIFIPKHISMRKFCLYDFLPSGNCYKVRLLLKQIGIPFERVEMNILKGETRTQDFLGKNPVGKISLLEINSEQYLSESNTILIYLSEGTEFLSYDPYVRARVMQWLFFKQLSHKPFIAKSQYLISILRKPEEYHQLIEKIKEPGYKALTIMENHLKITYLKITYFLWMRVILLLILVCSLTPIIWLIKVDSVYTNSLKFKLG